MIFNRIGNKSWGFVTAASSERSRQARRRGAGPQSGSCSLGRLPTHSGSGQCPIHCILCKYNFMAVRTGHGPCGSQGFSGKPVARRPVKRSRRWSVEPLRRTMPMPRAPRPGTRLRRRGCKGPPNREDRDVRRSEINRLMHSASCCARARPRPPSCMGRDRGGSSAAAPDRLAPPSNL